MSEVICYYCRNTGIFPVMEMGHMDLHTCPNPECPAKVEFDIEDFRLTPVWQERLAHWQRLPQPGWRQLVNITEPTDD